MPLSEHEQRLLEQIERALYAEDPKFASTVRGGRLRKPTRRRRLQGVAVFVVGLVLLVVGVAVPQLWLASSFPVLSVVGFLVMLGGAVVAVTSVGAGGQAPQQAQECRAGQEPLHRPHGGALPAPLRTGVAAHQIVTGQIVTGRRRPDQLRVAAVSSSTAWSAGAGRDPSGRRRPSTERGSNRARRPSGPPAAMPARTARTGATSSPASGC